MVRARGPKPALLELTKSIMSLLSSPLVLRDADSAALHIEHVSLRAGSQRYVGVLLCGLTCGAGLYIAWDRDQGEARAARPSAGRAWTMGVGP